MAWPTSEHPVVIKREKQSPPPQMRFTSGRAAASMFFVGLDGWHALRSSIFQASMDHGVAAAVGCRLCCSGGPPAAVSGCAPCNSAASQMCGRGSGDSQIHGSGSGGSSIFCGGARL